MIKSKTRKTKILDDGLVSLGGGHITEIVKTTPPLVMGEDIEIDQAAGTVRRLRDDLPIGPYTFEMIYDDRSAEIAAEMARLEGIREDGENQFAALPAWARGTRADADAYFETNLRGPFSEATTLAAMKAVVGTLINVVWLLTVAVIGLRNLIVPHVQGKD